MKTAMLAHRSSILVLTRYKLPVLTPKASAGLQFHSTLLTIAMLDSGGLSDLQLPQTMQGLQGIWKKRKRYIEHH